MKCVLLPATALLLTCAYASTMYVNPTRWDDNRLKWWQNILIYEIYPQSFFDSDGNGMGDLKGIQQKIEYLKELKVGAVWLNPFFKSPMKDNGYDISDFRNVDPQFGTMQDFKQMLHTLTENDIELILDFVPNHTSDQHEWFKKSSIKGLEQEQYADYYIWKDPKEWKDGKPVPPNNWTSMFAKEKPGSAWEWNDSRKQFYFHTFMVEQPDLNLRNKQVIQELKDILKFWMDLGVKGFRFDAVPHLIEDEQFRDEEPHNPQHTQNQPETYELITEFRSFFDAYSKKNSVDIFMTTEAYCNPEATIEYYGSYKKPGAHFPFNFLLLTDVNAGTDAKSLNETVYNYLDTLTPVQYPNWVSGNHDWPRIPSRMGYSSTVDIINTLSLLLPGSSTVFMGDEIGMDSNWRMNKDECPAGVRDDYRTPTRAPFQWSADKNAGFTKANKPWIPINPEYYHINVATQRKRSLSGTSITHLTNFKALMAIKKKLDFAENEVETFILDDYVFAFTRQVKYQLYVILINLGGTTSKSFKLAKAIPKLKNATQGGIPVRSVNLAEECMNSVQCTEKLAHSGFEMPPKSSMVLMYTLQRNMDIQSRFRRRPEF